jgi:hypothetical protein
MGGREDSVTPERLRRSGVCTQQKGDFPMSSRQSKGTGATLHEKPIQPDETKPKEYVWTAVTQRLEELADLIALANGEPMPSVEPEAAGDRIEELGLEPDSIYSDLPGAAEDLLQAYPLCVEAMTSFEVVLGVGGPDVRIVLECSAEEANWQPSPRERPPLGYETRRVLFRYSWSESAEVVLSGPQRETAEALARRVIPELM